MPPTLTYPGVYIEELPSGVHTITGVATSIAAFVGWANQGPVEEALLVQSWLDYEAAYGGLDSDSPMSYAVNQFFNNGGQQAYIVRIIWSGAHPPAPGTSPAKASTARAEGIGFALAMIQAAVGSISAQATLTVGPAVLQSLAITPQQPPPIPAGATGLQFSATGTYSDGSTQTPAGTTWASSDPGVLAVNALTGVANAVSAGNVTLTATAGLISASIPLTVSPATLQTITVTPSMPLLALGQSVQLSATATYSDQTKQDVTATATWTSSASSVISVTSAGLATAKAKSSADVTLTAAWAGKSGNASAGVSDASLQSIVITPANPVLQILPSAQTTTFSAVARFSDGTSGALSGGTWSSSNPTVATIDPNTGKATAVLAGTTTITVSSAAGTNFNQISAANASATRATAATGQLIIKNSGGTIYTTNGGNTNVGQVLDDINANGPGLVAFLNANGQLVITNVENRGTSAGTELEGDAATDSFKIGTDASETFANTAIASVTATTNLTVTAATLNAIAVSPASASVPNGLTLQLIALGTYSDGKTADLTGSATWTSGGAGVAVSSTQAGLVTGKSVNAAPVSVSAEWQGVTGSAAITVITAVVQSLAVTPASVSLLSGQNQKFTATASLSDGSSQDVSTSTAWTSSATGVATVDNTGMAKAVAAGGTLTLFAANPGAWGNNLQLSIQSGSSGQFGLQVAQVQSNGVPKIVESYVGLTTNSTDSQYAVAVIDNDSAYITFVDPATGLPPSSLAGTPAATSSPISLTGGSDGSVLKPADNRNFELELNADGSAGAVGVRLLDTVDIFNLLCVPGETDAPTISNLQGYCYQERAFYIVDSPQNTTVSKMESSGPVGSSNGSITGQNSINSAYYFPWVMAPDPLLGNRIRLFPPCGFVAGIYAATDTAAAFGRRQRASMPALRALRGCSTCSPTCRTAA